jgi:hypothetical protein
MILIIIKNIKEEKRNRNCGHFIFKNRVDIAMNEPISIQIQIQIETTLGSSLP